MSGRSRNTNGKRIRGSTGRKLNGCCCTDKCGPGCGPVTGTDYAAWLVTKTIFRVIIPESAIIEAPGVLCDCSQGVAGTYDFGLSYSVGQCGVGLSTLNDNGFPRASVPCLVYPPLRLIANVSVVANALGCSWSAVVQIVDSTLVNSISRYIFTWSASGTGFPSPSELMVYLSSIPAFGSNFNVCRHAGTISCEVL